jgi:hypothetical protein
LFSRLLILCPKDENKDKSICVKGITSIIALSKILFIIRLIHNVERKYELDKDASQIYDTHYDSLMNLIKECNNYDFILG